MAIRRNGADDAEQPTRSGDGTASVRLRDVEGAAVVSRRGVLWKTGLATVAGAAALTALDERRAEAATGGNFVLGENNSAGATTELSGTANPVMQVDGSGLNATGTTLVVNGPSGGAGLYVSGASTTSTTGLAINGSGTGTATGVYGGSGSGTGVSGGSSSGTGVNGSSSSGTGVNGSSTSGTGVTGSSTSGVGVNGTSNSNTAVNGTSTGGTAVNGTSTSGAGVRGTSHSATGVAGTSVTSNGVSGTSTSGTGVYAKSTTGSALWVTGKVHFSRSGSSSVSAGHWSKSVSVSGMTSSSLVLVTLQSNYSGVYVQSAVPASGKFTVHLGKKAPHTTHFAWFVIN